MKNESENKSDPQECMPDPSPQKLRQEGEEGTIGGMRYELVS